MTRLSFLFLCAVSVSVNAQPKQEPVIYDQIAQELCHCVQKSREGSIGHRLDSCFLVGLKQHAGALRRLGMDTSNSNEIAHFGMAIIEDLKDDCPDVYSQYMRPTTDPNANAPSFTGKLVSETLTADKKEYHVILRSADGKVMDFYSASKTGVNDHSTDNEVTIKYEIVVDSKTKEKRRRVLETMVTQVIPQEHR